MKKVLYLILVVASIFPTHAQVFMPITRDLAESAHQKLLLGPVQPLSILSSDQDRNLPACTDNYRKPLFKGSNYRSPSFDSTWAEQFQTVLDYIISVNNIHGGSLAVYAPGQGLFTAVSGISTQWLPVTSEMRFGIGSNTKLFIAITLVRLQEEGVLSLDDPLYQWLPSYAYVDSSATIRQLLSHQSGIFDFWNDNGSQFITSIWADTSRFWTAEEVLATIGPPHFAPGHGWSYSNTNYLLAALVIESATGQTWVQALHDYIFDPLVMDSTFVGAFEPRNGPVSSEYDIFTNIEITNSPMTAEYSQVHAAGGILSTAQEMVAWYSALFSGNLISTSSLEQVTDFDHISSYGLGLQYTEIFGHPSYCHNGAMLGYYSYTWYDLKTGATLSILYNGRDYSQDPFLPLISVLIEDFPKQVNDAGIKAIISPWSNSCNETVTPIVVLTNPGTDPLTSAEIHYFLDEEPVSTLSWTGLLDMDDTLNILLPALTTDDGSHTFTCYTSGPNGDTEGYTFNDTATSDFIVNIDPAIEAPLSESFDDEVFPPEGWSLGSHYLFDWGRTSLVSYSGTGSALKNNYFDGLVGEHYDLNLPPLNISGGIDADIDFAYAYAKYPGFYGDSLQVMVSADCGASWDILFNKGGSQLATAPNTSNLFIPGGPDDWQEENLSLSGYIGEVLIRFRAICGWGNNLYLDDVNVTLIIGTLETPPSPAFSAYPNPTASELLVSGLPANEEIYLTDIAGRLLIHARTTANITLIDLGQLPEGIYFLRTSYGSRKIVKI